MITGVRRFSCMLAVGVLSLSLAEPSKPAAHQALRQEQMLSTSSEQQQLLHQPQQLALLQQLQPPPEVVELQRQQQLLQQRQLQQADEELQASPQQASPFGDISEHVISASPEMCEGDVVPGTPTDSEQMDTPLSLQCMQTSNPAAVPFARSSPPQQQQQQQQQHHLAAEFVFPESAAKPAATTPTLGPRSVSRLGLDADGSAAAPAAAHTAQQLGHPPDGARQQQQQQQHRSALSSAAEAGFVTPCAAGKPGPRTAEGAAAETQSAAAAIAAVAGPDVVERTPSTVGSKGGVSPSDEAMCALLDSLDRKQQQQPHSRLGGPSSAAAVEQPQRPGGARSAPAAAAPAAAAALGASIQPPGSPVMGVLSGVQERGPQGAGQQHQLKKAGVTSKQSFFDRFMQDVKMFDKDYTQQRPGQLAAPQMQQQQQQLLPAQGNAQTARQEAYAQAQQQQQQHSLRHGVSQQQQVQPKGLSDTLRGGGGATPQQSTLMQKPALKLSPIKQSAAHSMPGPQAAVAAAGQPPAAAAAPGAPGAAAGGPSGAAGPCAGGAAGVSSAANSWAHTAGGSSAGVSGGAVRSPEAWPLVMTAKQLLTSPRQAAAVPAAAGLNDQVLRQHHQQQTYSAAALQPQPPPPQQQQQPGVSPAALSDRSCGSGSKPGSTGSLTPGMLAALDALEQQYAGQQEQQQPPPAVQHQQQQQQQQRQQQVQLQPAGAGPIAACSTVDRADGLLGSAHLASSAIQRAGHSSGSSPAKAGLPAVQVQPEPVHPHQQQLHHCTSGQPELQPPAAVQQGQSPAAKRQRLQMQPQLHQPQLQQQQQQQRGLVLSSDVCRGMMGQAESPLVGKVLFAGPEQDGRRLVPGEVPPQPTAMDWQPQPQQLVPQQQQQQQQQQQVGAAKAAASSVASGVPSTYAATGPQAPPAAAAGVQVAPAGPGAAAAADMQQPDVHGAHAAAAAAGTSSTAAVAAGGTAVAATGAAVAAGGAAVAAGGAAVAAGGAAVAAGGAAVAAGDGIVDECEESSCDEDDVLCGGLGVFSQAAAVAHIRRVGQQLDETYRATQQANRQQQTPPQQSQQQQEQQQPAPQSVPSPPASAAKASLTGSGSAAVSPKSAIGSVSQGLVGLAAQGLLVSDTHAFCMCCVTA